MSPPHPERLQCRSCQKWHTVHQHEVSVVNHGALHCPSCHAELVTWHGHFFYTLAVNPPKSSSEMDTLDVPGGA